MAPQVDQAKERVDIGKGKVEEPQKKRKLSHSSYTSEKFGTTIAHAATSPPLKLMEASIKATKVETMRRANEKAKKKERRASKAIKKAQLQGPRKSP